MIKILVAVAAAAAAFVLVAAPSGVLGMIDPDYCFDHPHRPHGATSHEESLSLFPPGPVCSFSTARGNTVASGPGWWPAAAASAAVVAGVAVIRLRR